MLIDNVDGPGGPVIVATQRTDPRVTELIHPEVEIIRRHANLYEFLQCDLQLPDSPELAAPLKRALIAASCVGMRAQ